MKVKTKKTHSSPRRTRAHASRELPTSTAPEDRERSRLWTKTRLTCFKLAAQKLISTIKSKKLPHCLHLSTSRPEITTFRSLSQHLAQISTLRNKVQNSCIDRSLIKEPKQHKFQAKIWWQEDRQLLKTRCIQLIEHIFSPCNNTRKTAVSSALKKLKA